MFAGLGCVTERACQEFAKALIRLYIGKKDLDAGCGEDTLAAAGQFQNDNNREGVVK